MWSGRSLRANLDMTLFTTAYIVPEAHAANLVPADGWQTADALHDALASFALEPGCTSPGTVVTVMMEFLSEYGIEMPSDDGHISAERFGPLAGIVCICGGEETSPFLRQLDRMMLMESQLGGYYEDFTGATWPEAGKEMLKVFNFIRDGLVKQQKSGGIYILCVR